MREYDVDKHKGHLIYAAATRAEGNKGWHAEGIVFSTNFPELVEKIHRMKSKVATGGAANTLSEWIRQLSARTDIQTPPARKLRHVVTTGTSCHHRKELGFDKNMTETP